MQIQFPPHLNIDLFLRDYWQKKPLLIRNAFPDFINPIEADELAGLACEEEIPSRIIQQHSPTDWRCRMGSFEASDFAQLPESDWSLLISDVETHLPEFQAYLEPFRFIPDWRIDDLMISYAPEGGSVGPHSDQYDVFLLQTSGRRRWSIHSQPLSEADFLPDLELKILREFETEQSWITEPGDLLYLPPGVAHFGVALEPCMTWSVGFRAPSQRDLVSAYLDDLIPSLKEQRYSDPELSQQPHPSEITPHARQKLRDTLRQQLSQNDDQLDLFLGRYLSEAGREYALEVFDELSPEQIKIELEQGNTLQKVAGIRCSYMQFEQEAQLFIGGENIQISLELAQLIGKAAKIDKKALTTGHTPSTLRLLSQLYNFGFLEFCDDL
ncbi:MAG: cupin domain-containing protein [Gammaproteobacteria bacterium]|nr:cupin domain-containing protein [Gammaproteobacteria bacterium]